MSQYKTYFKNQEAADYLGVSPQWLDLARYKGNGPKFHKLGRMIRYSKAELDAFMRQNLRSNTCEK